MWKRKYDIVLTKSLSRFGRDGEAIRRIRASAKRFIFEKNKIETENIKDELLISIIKACEQAENDWKSENIRWWLKKRAENGISELYNRTCYGYKKDKNGMFIIDEEEARVVRKIYDWYHEVYSIGGIIDKLE